MAWREVSGGASTGNISFCLFREVFSCGHLCLLLTLLGMESAAIYREYHKRAKILLYSLMTLFMPALHFYNLTSNFNPYGSFICLLIYLFIIFE